MKRLSAATLKQHIRQLLQTEGFGVLGTIGDPWPHPSLVAFRCADNWAQIFFYTARQTRKFSNFQINAEVSLLIDNRGRPLINLEETSALGVFGQARELSPSAASAGEHLFLAKHPQMREFCQHPDTAACVIMVDHYNLVYNFGQVFPCQPMMLTTE